MISSSGNKQEHWALESLLKDKVVVREMRRRCLTSDPVFGFWLRQETAS